MWLRGKARVTHPYTHPAASLCPRTRSWTGFQCHPNCAGGGRLVRMKGKLIITRLCVEAELEATAVQNVCKIHRTGLPRAQRQNFLEVFWTFQGFLEFSKSTPNLEFRHLYYNVNVISLDSLLVFTVLCHQHLLIVSTDNNLSWTKSKCRLKLACKVWKFDKRV